METEAHDSICKRKLTKSQKKEIRKQRVKEARKAKRLIQKHKIHDVVSSLEARNINKEILRRKRDENEQTILKLHENKLNGFRICIELEFDQGDEERTSICKQICLTYNSMKKSSSQLSLHITSASIEWKSYLHRLCGGILKWPISIHEESVIKSFPSEDLIFLSPDATDVLYDFDTTKVYIIGGIADRSVRKGVTLSYANSNQIRVMRLPIQEYLPIRQTHILNIDTVFTIIWKFLEVKSWQEVLESVIPNRRKNGKSQTKDVTIQPLISSAGSEDTTENPIGQELNDFPPLTGIEATSSRGSSISPQKALDDEI